MPPTTMLSLQNATLDNTVGALFLGVLAAMFLFGITTLQMYWYYHLYPKDSQLHKYSVAILWSLDTLHLALTIHAVYTYIVNGFGNILGLEHISWSIKLQVSVNVVIILVVHSLYALRVWILGEYHRGGVGYLVAFVLVGGFVIGAVLAYQIYTIHTYAELGRISWVINSAFATATGIDFIITASMCYYLWKSQAPASRLNSRISTIIQYTLSSGLLTSACSLSALFSYILLSNTFVFLGLQFILTKLYVASFLTMLNARKRTVTVGSSNTDDLNSENTTPVTDLIPRRYQLFSHKFRSSQSQTQSQLRTHRLRLRTATSSFWSPPPPPTLPDYDQGYHDYLPSNLDLEHGRAGAEGKIEKSLSDESETIRGTVKSLGSPTSPLSATSTDGLMQLTVQQPPSAYTSEAQISPPVKTSIDIRPLSTSYPWHAR
ncbi:hypothetical protein P691DRAFT_801836 [Macrolepiota fuliginosa MF-IS2]|uniref:DUF6534 domain-containing protein n=1 Tax=Macrolepiota fuliginosa MF-IS2 TaxID=1400762 RepID=A0A9P5XAK4_9AGAR|nr:hypothetical protein P691DRAFT_801836 [Macrolepiota fuliginosa MF-IS2]